MKESVKKEKLWTKNFVVLWQGQLVSMLGDTAYSIALGFWVLAVTGSTALMGALMAASTLPGILVSPFAGVWVDTGNKKGMLIAADFIRGVSIVLVALAAYSGIIEIWMVFAAGVILSVCGAVFRPGINSSIPDLVPPAKIPAAVSVFSMVGTGSGMVGNLGGGYLFAVLGAPAMFLINGLSYLFSGSSIFFVRIPSVKREAKNTFFQDLKAGYAFIWRIRGLRYAIITAALINFFFNVALILLLPMFQKDADLGPAKYGVTMACFMGGAMIGFLLASIMKTTAEKRFFIFMLSDVISNACLILFANTGIYMLMLVSAFAAGIFNSILNVLLMSAVQIAAPQEMRGKVLSLLSMLTQGLTPFAMALGGVLGGVLPIRAVISVCFILGALLIVPFGLLRPFKRFLNYDCTKQTIDDIA